MQCKCALLALLFICGLVHFAFQLRVVSALPATIRVSALRRFGKQRVCRIKASFAEGRIKCFSAFEDSCINSMYLRYFILAFSGQLLRTVVANLRNRIVAHFQRRLVQALCVSENRFSCAFLHFLQTVKRHCLFSARILSGLRGLIPRALHLRFALQQPVFLDAQKQNFPGLLELECCSFRTRLSRPGIGRGNF